jgi:hypothetical protein
VSRRRRSGDNEVREGALEEPHRFREEPACVFDRSAGRG